MSNTVSTGRVGRMSVVAQSLAAAFVTYLTAAAAEFSLIRTFQPTERELAWVSDLVLASALGVAVYLWLHLRATRQALLERERSELVLNTQLAIAADLQRRLLPTLPPRGGPLDWAAALKSAGQIGGDFYDLVSLADGRVLLLVADVSGKGIPAAMALSTLRAAFRALARRVPEPATLLTQLSAALYDQWGGTPYFTCVVALIDLQGGTLTYANAAHPAAVLVGPSGARYLEALGPPAALLAGCVYHDRPVAIGPGDVCVLVSDGVTEALGDDAAPNQLENWARAEEVVPGCAADICHAIMDAALAGRGPGGVPDWDDDRTVVVMAMLDDAYALPLRAATTTGQER